MQHYFMPNDGLHIIVDVANTNDPFVTCVQHIYRNGYTGLALKVPAGFRCDFASFPKSIWWLFPRVGRYSRAAMYHDYLYRTHLVGRFSADAIFRVLLRVDEVPRWQRVVFFVALRLFGGRAWRNSQRGNSDAGS